MRVLGIDPGSLKTGYGVVDKKGGSISLVASGVIIAPQSIPIDKRLAIISSGLTSVIAEHKPEAMAIESIFFAKNVRSAIMLGQARGVAIVSASSRGIPVFEYSPRSIKLAATGGGGAAKDAVGKMMKLLLKTEADLKPDEADALAIAICHLSHMRVGVSVQSEKRTSARSWRAYKV